MAGNIGSFISALTFPYLLSWTGCTTRFFPVGTALNVSAVFMWMVVKPDKWLEEY